MVDGKVLALHLIIHGQFPAVLGLEGCDFGPSNMSKLNGFMRSSKLGPYRPHVYTELLDACAAAKSPKEHAVALEHIKAANGFLDHIQETNNAVQGLLGLGVVSNNAVFIDYEVQDKKGRVVVVCLKSPEQLDDIIQGFEEQPLQGGCRDRRSGLLSILKHLHALKVPVPQFEKSLFLQFGDLRCRNCRRSLVLPDVRRPRHQVQEKRRHKLALVKSLLIRRMGPLRPLDECRAHGIRPCRMGMVWQRLDPRPSA